MGCKMLQGEGKNFQNFKNFAKVRMFRHFSDLVLFVVGFFLKDFFAGEICLITKKRNSSCVAKKKKSL